MCLDFAGEQETGVILDPPRSSPLMPEWMVQVRDELPFRLVLGHGHPKASVDPLTTETDVATFLSYNVTDRLGRGFYPSQAGATWHGCVFHRRNGFSLGQFDKHVGGGWGN